MVHDVDESGMPLEQQSPQVVAKKEKKNVRYCGIYPFNPKEVLDHDPTKEKSTQGDRVPMTDDPVTDSCEIFLCGTVETSIEATFTAEEETLFTR